MTFAKRLGRNVVALRERAGISQEALAFRAAMHRTAVGKVERGETIPLADSLVRLAGALDCSPNDLLAGLSWQPSKLFWGDYRPFEEQS